MIASHQSGFTAQNPHVNAGADTASPEDRPAANAALLRTLSDLQDQAKELLGEPLRPQSDNFAGYIEAVTVDSAGHIWVAGWIRRSLGCQFSVVIADRQKYAGAMSVICYDRADLAPGDQAMFGIICTDWRPSSDTDEVFLFLGPELKPFLRAVRPLPKLGGELLTERFAEARLNHTQGQADALQALLLDAQNWLPKTAQIAGFTVEAAVEELLVLPGFGSLVQGWVVSPAKPVAQFSLRLGQRVLRGVPGSLSLRPRPDLATAYPRTPRLLERAGFTVVTRGVLYSEDITHPVLKVHFEDGTSVNVSIDANAVRRIGHAVPVDDVLRLYPGIAAEEFFEDFANALRADTIKRLRSVVMVKSPEQNQRYVIVAVPSHSSDAYLLADGVARHVSSEGEACSVMLMADQSCDRGQLPVLADAIEAQTGRRCGVCLVEQADKPLWALPAVLAATGAERFLFMAKDVFLDQLSWRAVLTGLKAEGDALLSLRYRDGGTPAAFVWTKKAFDAWSHTTKHPLGIRHCAGLTDKAISLPGYARTAVALLPSNRLFENVDQQSVFGP
ncbi:hypothetical protein E2C06_24330 [Dankookia rubra]|uniref:Uncharacterized protein n=1 Tax=Dankookia rubra TaxID=1442381 RepID=A0A4V3A9R3_9PROT|nr:hypothetical protein [Dankookia rubra]TDH60005.1 hypothetical protein E2C06_24330 [Dankookia rubra]